MKSGELKTNIGSFTNEQARDLGDLTPLCIFLLYSLQAGLQGQVYFFRFDILVDMEKVLGVVFGFYFLQERIILTV